MARNLVREAETQEAVEKQEVKAAEANKPKQQDKEKERETILLTFEEVILHNLNLIIKNQSDLLLMMSEGFKKVGVKFD